MDYLKEIEEAEKEMEKPVIFRSEIEQSADGPTVKDIKASTLNDDAVLEAEWEDRDGYHREKVTGIWESESGAVVLKVGGR